MKAPGIPAYDGQMDLVIYLENFTRAMTALGVSTKMYVRQLILSNFENSAMGRILQELMHMDWPQASAELIRRLQTNNYMVSMESRILDCRPHPNESYADWGSRYLSLINNWDVSNVPQLLAEIFLRNIPSESKSAYVRRTLDGARIISGKPQFSPQEVVTLLTRAEPMPLNGLTPTQSSGQGKRKFGSQQGSFQHRRRHSDQGNQFSQGTPGTGVAQSTSSESSGRNNYPAEASPRTSAQSGAKQARMEAQVVFQSQGAPTCGICGRRNHTTEEHRPHRPREQSAQSSSHHSQGKPPGKPSNSSSSGSFPRHNNNVTIAPRVVEPSSIKDLDPKTELLRHQIHLGGQIKVLALLDTGSQVNLLSRRVVDKYALPMEPAEESIAGAHSAFSPKKVDGAVTTLIAYHENGLAKPLRFLVTDLQQEEAILGLQGLTELGCCMMMPPPPVEKEGPTAKQRISEDVELHEPDAPLQDVLEDPKAPPDVYERIMAAINPLLQQNEAIPKSSFITHRLAPVKLPLSSWEPVYRPQYPLPPAYHQALLEQVKEWLTNGRIEEVREPSGWHTALTVVRKSQNGVVVGLRFCGDFRHINELMTNLPTTNVPNIEDAVHRIARGRFFARIDAEAAFNQLPVVPEHRDPLTFSVRTEEGLKYYRFVCAPFGLLHLSHHFQNLMQDMLRTVPNATIYIDDVAIGSRDEKEFIRDVKQVLEIFNRYSVRIKASKCVFARTSTRILGYKVSHNCVELDPVKAQAIQDWPMLSDKRSLLVFLGFVNFVRSLVPRMSHLTAPLDELRNDPRIKEKLAMPEAREAFQAIKDAVATAITCRPFDPELPVMILCDASNRAIAAALLQGEAISPEGVVALAARKYHDYEKRAHVFAHELLAVVFALKKFRRFVLGRRVVVFSDHRALSYVLSTPHLHPTLAAWAEFIGQFDIQIVHYPGCLMVLCDSMSRMHEARRASHQVAVFSLNATSARVDAAVEQQDESDRQQVLKLEELAKQAHLRGHIGHRAMVTELVSRHSVFHPKLAEIARRIQQACEVCQKFNGSRPIYHAFSTPDPLDAPWKVVFLDISTGYPKTKNGNQHVLVLVDRFTRFVCLRPLVERTTEAVAAQLLMVFSWLGVPEEIQSDGSSELVSALWKHVVDALHVQRRPVVPHAHFHQGLVERHIQSTQQMLRKMLAGSMALWDVMLEPVQYFLNSRFNASIHASPFELMFGRTPMPTSAMDARSWQDRQDELKTEIYPLLRRQYELLHSRTARQFGKRNVVREEPLEVGTLVRLKDEYRSSKWDPLFVGTYRIKQLMQGGSYLLEDADGSILRRLVDRPQLKVVEETATSDLPSYEVDRILDHRNDVFHREYLVAWKDYPIEEATWIDRGMFDDTAIVDVYERGLARQLACASAREAPSHGISGEPLPQVDRVMRPRKRKYL